MAIPIAVKAAVSVVTDPKLRKVIGGLILGVVIVIIAPIAILLGMMEGGQAIDWDSPEMKQYIIDNMSDEEKVRLRYFENMMTAIENEITAQGLRVEPIKAQVVFLCTLIDYEETDTIYLDFVSCFADNPDDETIFQRLADKFGVSLTAEEKEKILLLCESVVESQTVPPRAVHTFIGSLMAGDTTPVSAGYFYSPFHDLDWRSCVTSNYGNRKDPFTGEESNHAGLDLGAPIGTNIYSAKQGKVLLVRYDDYVYGNFVVINHGGKQATMYAHCSAILVSEGDAVTADTIVALVGSTGQSTGPHLHFEIIMNGQPVNPRKYLDASTP